MRARDDVDLCSALLNYMTLYFIYAYDRKFGHPPTSKRIGRRNRKDDKEFLREQLTGLANAGWIAYHPDRKDDIEILIPLAEDCLKPEDYEGIVE